MWANAPLAEKLWHLILRQQPSKTNS